jgi:hypothetical protein
MEHVIGMLLGTEEDWPTAFEALMRRLDPKIPVGSDKHSFTVERVTIEPFNLRAKPRYSLVIDRLAHWYYNPREWVKKVAIMDGVYLLNNPFTFQSMEKHTAYCAMMRLGLKIPETWMVPQKQPPENERFPYTARKYNRPFRLEDVAHEVGYPLYMKPFDGGAWVGVTRVTDDADLHRRYDESGDRLMHLQTSLEGFDVFARSLSIGPDTMVMRFEPDRPIHDRYQVDHDFLSAGLGEEVVSIGRLVNAFFRWEFNSCETIIKGDEVYPIDYANACPDISLTSLHYYFPWAICALAKWSIFCAATGRPMRVDQDIARYNAIGDDESVSYREKLDAYRRLSDEYFERERYEAFCAEHLAHVDQVMVEYVESDDFDRLIVDTITSTFPAHEQERFVAHYRGLLGAWAKEQREAAPAP